MYTEITVSVLSYSWKGRMIDKIRQITRNRYLIDERFELRAATNITDLQRVASDRGSIQLVLICASALSQVLQNR